MLSAKFRQSQSQSLANHPRTKGLRASPAAHDQRERPPLHSPTACALPPAILALPPHAGFPLEPQAQHATALILICDATALQDQLWHDGSLL
jgi:hypothetical protein